MPTTANRRWCIPLAIRWFQLQRYPDRRLLIVFDGPGSIRDLLPVRDSRIECVELSGERSLGNKFNACVELAETDWIALWADDDWHPIDRLDVLMGHCDDGDVLGASWALFHELIPPGDTWIYRGADATAPFVGGTMLFKRSVWADVRFADIPRSVDTAWQRSALKAGARFVEVGEAPPYVAMVHGQATGRLSWPPSPRSSVYTRWEGDLSAIMDDDLGAYLRAFSRWTTEDRLLDDPGRDR